MDEDDDGGLEAPTRDSSALNTQEELNWLDFEENSGQEAPVLGTASSFSTTTTTSFSVPKIADLMDDPFGMSTQSSAPPATASDPMEREVDKAEENLDPLRHSPVGRLLWILSHGNRPESVYALRQTLEVDLVLFLCRMKSSQRTQE